MGLHMGVVVGVDMKLVAIGLLVVLSWVLSLLVALGVQVSVVLHS